MPDTKRQPADKRTITRRQVAYIVLAAAAIVGLVFSPAGDQGFFAIIFIGPLLTGIAARLLDASWKLAAAPWALSGAFWFVYDGVVYNEDMAAHATMTIMMIALVALGALIGRGVRRLFSISATARA